MGMWLAYPFVIREYAWGIYSIMGRELLRYVFDFLKFKRGASYHAISAKLFGISLLIATIAIMGFGSPYPFMSVAMVMGIASELEGFIISCILPVWTYNVKHIGKAVKIRGALHK